MAASEPEHKRLRICTVLLCLSGIVAASVALKEHVVLVHGLATGPSFCYISEHINCEAVNGSPWSIFLGIPIASYGLFFFVSLLALAIISGRDKGVSFSVFASIVALAGLLGSLASIALFAVSEFIIGALCIMCVTLYAVNFALLFIAWKFAYRRNLVSGALNGASVLLTYSGIVLGVAPASPQGRSKAWIAAVLLVFAAVTIYYLPVGIVRTVQGASVNDPHKNIDVVAAWRSAPVAAIQNTLESGALEDYAKGTSGSPIEIVEFADFECPACRRHYFDLKPVLEKFAGSYRLIFRNYPLDNACNPGITREFHRYACSAGNFARCAGEQGKFWEAADFLFGYPGLESQKPVPEVEATIIQVGAKELGLDQQGIEECMRSGRHIKKMRQDIEEGDRIGLAGTPSFWINGKFVPSTAPADLERIFQVIVAAAKR